MGTNDLALVELCQPVPYNTAIQPIALSTGFPGEDDAEVTVAGWGTTQESGNASDILLAVVLDTMDNEVCRGAYSWIGDGQICAGVPQGGMDACQGDSGGALFWKNPEDNVIYQVGIVSSGRGC